MALSITQIVAAYPTSSPATGSTYMIGPYNQAAGHFMGVLTRNGSSTSVSSVSDTAGNTWHSKTLVGSTVRIQWWYAYNCLGNASNTITIHLPGTVNSPNAILYDVSGAITATDPTDVSVSLLTTTGTSITSPSYTTAAAYELLLAAACNNIQSTNSWSVSGTSGTWALDGPWPAGSNLPNANVAGSHQLNSVIQTSQTVTIGNGTSPGYWVIAVLGVKGIPPSPHGASLLLGVG